MNERISDLSDIQKRCLRLVAANRTSKEIAIEVGLSPMTVDQYLSRATAILGASNRRDAARMLIESEGPDAFNQFEFKPDMVAQSAFSPILNGSEAASTVRSRPLLRRLMDQVAGAIGGSRHDLNALQVLIAVARMALVTTGALAAIIATGYWLNHLFQ